MQTIHGKTIAESISKSMFSGMGLSALALALCATGLPAAAQDQVSQSAQAEAQQQGTGPSAPAEAPPVGNAPDQYSNAPDAGPQNQGVPATLSLPAGTAVSVRVNGWLSSDKSHPGDTFSATLDQPLIANGWVVARRGQIVTGRVDVAQKNGHGNPASQLGLSLSELTMVDGQVLPVSTQLVQSAGAPPRPNNTGRNVAVVGTTAVIGAVIGGAVGGGAGAAVGAGIGGTAGAIGVMSTRGGPTVVYPETLLTFQTQAPIAVATERSAVAFQPVGQGDYGRAPSRGDQDAYGGPGQRRFAAGPPPYPYYYPYPYWGYPGPIFFGGYGFYGPRFGGGFRGGFRR